jgi:monovalent cation:H+ antiporter-2, CPA2 family
MEVWFLLTQVLFLVAGSFFLGIVAEKLKQSPIVGYLLAGILMGPWVFDRQAVSQLAELGVALLLFSIGLEFSFSRLKRMGVIALGGGTLQVLITMLVFALGFYYFLPFGESFALGAMVTLSSTAVVMRVLSDRAEIDSPRGRNAMGILLIQDIAVVPLVIMVSMIGQGGAGQAIFPTLLKTVLAGAGLILMFFLLFHYLVPFILKKDTVHGSRDLLILMAFLAAVGSAWLSHAAGLSPALGAFIAGMMLAESGFAGQLLSDIGSLRTLFVTLFFTSIGMLIDPQWFVTHLHWIVAGLAGMIIGKVMTIYFIVRLFKCSPVQSLATGITLAQIGEFSFVLATAAYGFGLFGNDMFKWIVSVTIMSIFISPFMVSHAIRVSRGILTRLSRHLILFPTDDEAQPQREPERIFIIGFGPAGQKVADALIAHNMTPAVIEMRPRTARVAQKRELTVHMGDAASEDVLLHAGVSGACLVVVTIPDPRAVRFIVETIRRISPDATVIARGRYHIHNREIEKAGAHLIVDEENMVGDELAKAVIICLSGDGRYNLSCACTLGGSPDDLAQ